MKLIPLLLLLAVAAPAQTDFYCSVSPPSYSKSLFQHKRTAKAVRHWICTVTNYSDSPIVLTEGSVIRALHTAGVPAYSVESVRNMFLENQRRGKLKTIGRILTYVANGATLVAAADIANMSDNWRIGLTLGAQSLPTLARAAGNRAPSIELFERVAWTVQIGVEPHSTVAVSMFSGPWDGELIINGVFAESLPSTPPLTSQLFPDPIEFAKYLEFLEEAKSGSGTVTFEAIPEVFWDLDATPTFRWNYAGELLENSHPSRAWRVSSWASPDHKSHYGRL